VIAPRYLPRAAFEGWRGPRGLTAAFEALWTAGNPAVLAAPTVAIVGTRAPSSYGRCLATRFAAELGHAGCTIVSGLALGIDAAAHRGALQAGTPTVGILGSGHHCFFPQRNAVLGERIIAAGGAVLSPYPPHQPAQGFQFLARNGVVAALADAVVVIDAPARSGALNTASWAAGTIPVLAVPGDVDRASCAGCHALIRDGAILARSAADVLEAIHLTAPAAQSTVRLPEDPLERAIVVHLRGGESDLDALVDACRTDVPSLLAALARLELDGHIEARDGARWSLSC
jgi:DNA processing protein